MTYSWRTLLWARPRLEDRATRMFTSCVCVPTAGCSWALQAGTVALPGTSVEIPNINTLREVCIPAGGKQYSCHMWNVTKKQCGCVVSARHLLAGISHCRGLGFDLRSSRSSSLVEKQEWMSSSSSDEQERTCELACFWPSMYNTSWQLERKQTGGHLSGCHGEFSSYSPLLCEW